MHVHEPNYDPSYYEDEKVRAPSTKLVAFAALALEMALAIVSIISFDGFADCCGEYFFVTNTPEGQETWDKSIFWIAVGYLGLVVTQVAFVAMEWPVAIFNPLVGFFLTLSGLYSAFRVEVWIMYGLETTAVLLQSYVLFRDQRSFLLCLQTLLNYGVCAFVLYAIISLSQQGGYCVVGGLFETIFQESTCNTNCNDVDIPCSVCDVDQSSCFIPF
jgi:hypothetical protein